jgi:DNA-binding transcriptional LysR family regulator
VQRHTGLLGRARPAAEQISRALDDLKSEQEHPFGRLRLYVSDFAGVAVIARIWARFLSTFPDVQLEVHAAEALVDIVAKGFDAGIGSKDRAGRGHDRRPRDGTHEGDRGWRASVLRTATPAAHAR